MLCRQCLTVADKIRGQLVAWCCGHGCWFGVFRGVYTSDSGIKGRDTSRLEIKGGASGRFYKSWLDLSVWWDVLLAPWNGRRLARLGEKVERINHLAAGWMASDRSGLHHQHGCKSSFLHLGASEDSFLRTVSDFGPLK